MDVPSLGRNENNDAEHLIKRKVLMTALRYTVKFKKTLLASLIGLSVSQYTFALQEISDAGLSEATGEGIAMLPENFRMVFQGANDNPNLTSGMGIDYLDRTKDTGYIRYIPVGPLTTEATARGAQKADIFLYGLALSRADTDINNRYNSSSTGQVKSWGTTNNPWLLKVQTALSTPDFAGVNKPLSYLSFEAPAYDIAGFTGANSTDDYHLKLGLWTDVFMRNPTVAAPDNNPAGWGAGLSNRLRLQAIWNNFSINGSSINLFQTLGGATTSGGLSTSYNNTLGLAGTLRFNGGDTQATDTSGFKATIVDGTATRTNQEIYLYSSTDTTRATTGMTNNTCPDVASCYQYRALRTTDTYNGVSFTLPSNLSVLRFSTQGVAGENASTPAIDSAATAPTFAENEGLFLYGANFNLVLGSLYQPLVIGVADDGKNLNMEITRIPNQANVYQKIYTDYANPNSTTYLGSTCNVYQCGKTVGGTFYPATHSSITIGSTKYSGAASNLVTGYSGADAIGVSFGALKNIATSNITQNYYQLQYKYRQKNQAAASPRWDYLQDNGTYTAGYAAAGGTYSEFNLADWINVDSVNHTTFSIDPRVSHAAYKVQGRTNAADFCTGAVAQSGACAGAAWGALPGAVVNGSSWVSNPGSATLPSTREYLAPKNLGSAVIDGMLIQHMKITTRGL